MAETALPATAIHVVPIRQHVTIVAEAQDLGLEASDDVNGNYFVPSGKDLIIALNTDVGAQTVSIDCAPDEYGRDGSVPAYRIGADEGAFFGIITKEGYDNANQINITVSDAAILLAVLRLP